MSQEAFEEWIETQAENWMHETYYYRDLKACWKAATERAAGIAEDEIAELMDHWINTNSAKTIAKRIAQKIRGEM